MHSLSRYRDRIFATDVSVSGLADPAGAFQWLRAVEAELTRFDPDSALSTLNRRRDAEVSPLLMEVILAALPWVERTGAMVSPFLGRQMIELGYDRDFDEIANAAVPSQARRAETAGSIHIDIERRRVRLPVGVDLDLGGFAKGWAADKLRERDGSRRGMANIGGDVRVWSDAEPWRLRTDSGVEFDVLEGGVATSSTRRRAWMRDGERVHHIVDPRTGSSSDSDCVEATVVAGDALTAEALAKLAVLLGIADAPQELSALHPQAGWVLLDRDGDVHIGGHLAARTSPSTPPRKEAT